MNNIYTIIKVALISLSTFILCTSCNDKTASTTPKTTTETSKTPEVLGKSHFLENEGIQLQLPKNFERYSSAKYEALLKTFLKNPILKLEQQRLRHLRKIDGNLYIFFDDASKSTITINTIPHQPITKTDAKAILADILRDQKEMGELLKKEYTKVATSFSDGASVQVLKSIFKVTDSKKARKKTEDRYQYKYYIASEDKYIIIDANTAFEIDFDKYLEKLKF